VSVNQGLAQISSDFMIAALLIYSLAVLTFAGDFAFGRPRRAPAGKSAAAERTPELAAVGAGTAVADVAAGGAGSAPAAPSGAAGSPAEPAEGPAGGTGSLPQRRGPMLQAIGNAGPWIRAAVALSVAGVATHLVAVVFRGFAVHRAPWGNMYEFVTALTCVAAIFFVYVMIRYRAWALGVFVIGSIVIALGLAETVIYTAAGPLVPALQSYWLSIHVTAMTLATGIFFVAAVLGILYPVAARYRARVAAGKVQPGSNGLLERIPEPAQLDKLTYRTVIFGFPIWTFGVIAGAIWADQAWGRYWGWDPVETWAFITWVLYAAYLHARATAGWRRLANYIQLLGFASLAFNILVVQVFITGLHSYAGVS
jgi:cytochrome c-type biogenesis protein CcsB